MDIIRQLLSLGSNPQQIMASPFVQQALRQNPNIQIGYNQFAQSGLSEKEFVMQFMKQNNININAIVDEFRRLGIKL